jgi:hypothetical protein
VKSGGGLYINSGTFVTIKETALNNINVSTYGAINI